MSLRFFLPCALLIALFLHPDAWGCPFCDAPTTTLGEQLNSARVAVLAKWSSAQKPDPNTFAEGTTTYEVIFSAGTGADDLKSGQTFIVPRYNSGRAEEEYLLFASLEEDHLVWGLPSPVSRECWKYLVESPQRTLSHQERLPYYLASLENSDPDIAMDAYGEFAGIPYEGLKEITDRLPREQIKSWLTDPLIIPTRRGLYGLMLGLCGTPEDAKFLFEIIREQPENSRVGIDGMMAGYLLLTGPDGLKELTACKLTNPDSPVHEVYALLQTLRFMWNYGRDVIEAEGLRDALRELLKHPEFSGIVILDLARWQDWQMMDQLVAGYGQEPFADAHARQCIVRFLLAAEKDAGTPQGIPTDVDYAAKAKAHLEKIRETDPAVIKYVERYSFD